MANLIFSFNIVLPLFFLMALGFLLAKEGMLSPEFRKKATSLVFYVALPASLFNSVATSDMRSAVNLRFILFAVGTSLALFFISWGVCRLVLKDNREVAAAVHGAFRGNFAYIGMAVAQNLMGRDNLPTSVMCFAFVVPMYNVLAIWLLSHYDESGKKPSAMEEIWKILKNPLILAILAGIPFSLLQVTIPAMFAKTISYLAQLATPLALLLIGANLRPETFLKKPKGILLATFLKIVFAPLAFTALAILIGFRGEELGMLYVLHAVPSAANSYIMTQQMNGDAELGAGVVMATSLGSILTIALGIFWLRSLGFV